MIYGKRSNGKQHGVVLTRECVVEAMLNFVGYLPSKDLCNIKIIEPSSGDGAFALHIIKRLHQSSILHAFDFEKALENIKLYEIDEHSITRLTANVSALLKEYDVTIPLSMIMLGDFLTLDIPCCDVVIGNPPYVRHENIPDSKKEVYRKLFRTFKHRSDLYIPFYEKGLNLLNKNGKLSFICSNRWLKNQYGENLRKLVSSRYDLLEVIDLENTNPFEESVIAYPAITTISNTSIGIIPKYYQLTDLNELNQIPDKIKPNRNLHLQSSNWFMTEINGERYPNYLETISKQGFKIGIGVATGCDQIFISNEFDQKVEKELLLPILTSRDIKGDKFIWGGKYVLNPFDHLGNLIDLNLFPKAKDYLNSNSRLLLNRHISKKQPKNWFRTIDKIDAELKSKSKIILPDISGNKYVFIDEGNFYPHHNLYYITGPDKIKLTMLAAILMSDFVRNQLLEISNKMNGGYPRWQSQNLKKIRIPIINSFPKHVCDQLVKAYYTKNISQINSLLNLDDISAYKITDGQMKFAFLS
ncbi:MAG: Eco57I restriction-modification methylase domain-containing protein [Bacteroidia bacterium]|nr:Eco57I restriction-modification methylase domain-containing protein [Bacteroidia bacterium]